MSKNNKEEQKKIDKAVANIAKLGRYWCDDCSLSMEWIITGEGQCNCCVCSGDKELYQCSKCKTVRAI